MSNLIQYIIQEDPEKEMKKNNLDYATQNQPPEDKAKYKDYKFSSKNLLENRFDFLTLPKSAQNKDESSKIDTSVSQKTIANNNTSYKIAQNNKGNITNKPSVTFDDIYFSTLDADGKVIYKGTDLHEGGLSNRKNDLGGLTNYGVRQDALNEYNNWHAPLKKEAIFQLM